MPNVNIHLYMKSTGKWIKSLSIPHHDLQRLTHRPLKWLRFAAFSVRGAQGHLITDHDGGSVVDYGVSFDNLADDYYYKLDHDHLAGFGALNGRGISTALTPSYFSQKVHQRDGRCVFTHAKGGKLSVATHIIPKKKGNDYISQVIHDRSAAYEQLPSPSSPSTSGNTNVNAAVNGILLRKDLHLRFRHGQITFLRTPNFAMSTTDIPQINQGPDPNSRITLQYLKIDEHEQTRNSHYDARVDWRKDASPPSNIILDFAFGAAVAKHWMCDPLCQLLQDHLYKTLPAGSLEHRSSKLKSDKSDGQLGDLSSRPVKLPQAMDEVLFLPTLLEGASSHGATA